ncbi:SecY-interacting protein [Chimaeribacter arupi]|uniref:Protein Syd n=1 Tax=Chimaeribacter arupi TaxID=2060066 RepID=A0A2N5EN17_9GAMM|nr:SecY-interacting protein [Chimaeribacter arupi]PLR35741.1 SecY-interacting protein [Chimaeribacter arupi]PLR49849.1 SecY-interacting protein [Chimaeribacter arupi]
MKDTVEALSAFTQRYEAHWQAQTGFAPASEALLGVPSPCVLRSSDEAVYWQAQPFSPPATLANVERALDIQLRDEIHAFYTSQYAGDMTATFDGQALTLLQVWSEEDFTRLQENLIGHLVTQKRLKLSPTLFIGTTDSEMLMVSLCNLTGNVVLESFGTARRTVLAPTLPAFLNQLQPVAA